MAVEPRDRGSSVDFHVAAEQTKGDLTIEDLSLKDQPVVRGPRPVDFALVRLGHRL